MLSAARHAKSSTGIGLPALMLNQTRAVFLGPLGLATGGPHRLRVIQVDWAIHLPEKESGRPATPLTPCNPIP